MAVCLRCRSLGAGTQYQRVNQGHSTYSATRHINALGYHTRGKQPTAPNPGATPNYPGNSENPTSPVQRLADQARTRLANPTPELMAQVFDILDLELTRTASHRFEGTGSIPISEDRGDDVFGDVHEAGPQPP